MELSVRCSLSYVTYFVSCHSGMATLSKPAGLQRKAFQIRTILRQWDGPRYVTGRAIQNEKAGHVFEIPGLVVYGRPLFVLKTKQNQKSYVYWTVHHLYSCVKRKNQLDATYFII